MKTTAYLLIAIFSIAVLGLGVPSSLQQTNYYDCSWRWHPHQEVWVYVCEDGPDYACEVYQESMLEECKSDCESCHGKTGDEYDQCVADRDDCIESCGSCSDY